MDMDNETRYNAALRSRERGRSIRERLSKDNSPKDNSPRELFPNKASAPKELFPTKVSRATTGGKAQMDQVDDTTILSSGMFDLALTVDCLAAASTSWSRGKDTATNKVV
jgi:hypothetical protein